MGSIRFSSVSSSNHVTIPRIGFGTAVWPFASSDAMKEAILNAIKLGYRHFDSAALYQSEKPLGEAIAEALRSGLIKSRDELFITSKLYCCDAHHDRVLPALQMSLRLHNTNHSKSLSFTYVHVSSIYSLRVFP